MIWFQNSILYIKNFRIFLFHLTDNGLTCRALFTKLVIFSICRFFSRPSSRPWLDRSSYILYIYMYMWILFTKPHKHIHIYNAYCYCHVTCKCHKEILHISCSDHSKKFSRILRIHLLMVVDCVLGHNYMYVVVYDSGAGSVLTFIQCPNTMRVE